MGVGSCVRRSKFQGVAKGVRQEEFDHFFSFSGRFRSLFGHFFWCFCHFFRHFLPNSFCRSPLRQGVKIYYLNSCQSRFSGVYLVLEVFQDTWRSNKENRSACWKLECCPVWSLHGLKLCKSVSRSDLVPISFWMLTTPWILYPIWFDRHASRFVVFQTKLAHSFFCLVPINMLLLMCCGSFVPGSLCGESCERQKVPQSPKPRKIQTQWAKRDTVVSRGKNSPDRASRLIPLFNLVPTIVSKIVSEIVPRIASQIVSHLSPQKPCPKLPPLNFGLDLSQNLHISIYTYR